MTNSTREELVIVRVNDHRTIKVRDKEGRVVAEGAVDELAYEFNNSTDPHEVHISVRLA